MRDEDILTINIDGALRDMFWDLSKKCGIDYHTVINIAVHKIANGDNDAFVMEPFDENIDFCTGTLTVGVDRFAYYNCCVACKEHGVSAPILVRAYIVRCVNARRIFL